MFKKVLGFILLPSMILSIAPFASNKEYDEVNKNVSTENIVAKSDNPNNHEMVFYNSAESWAGEYMNWDAELTEVAADGESQDAIELTGVYSIIVKLKDGIDFDTFEGTLHSTYLTLYDITNKEYDPIGVISLVKENTFKMDPPLYVDEGYNENAASFWVEPDWLVEDFGVELEEYHNYSIGFNINEGDDLKVYSNAFSKEVPELSQFDVTSSETSLTIDYALADPEGLSTLFEYNELYFEVDGTKYNVEDTSGQVVIEGLKPAKEYNVIFGYSADKIVSGEVVTPLTKETTYFAETLIPANYSFEEEILVTTILLIVFLVVLLILISMMFYWNYQRRKISGLALVVGEDTEVYDPIYSHNYQQQEDESGIPNAASSNKGDEVQDNQEEPYGYFDEVEENYYEDDVYDIDNPDEGELL